MIKYINNHQTKNILILHGLACDISYFDEMIKELSDKYNILLPELFGHYKNSIEDFTIVQESDNICQYCFTNSIEIDIIVAHSMSSILAFHIDKKINTIKNIFLLEGNIVKEDFEWSSQISEMTKNKFNEYWVKFQKQYPLILKMKLKKKLDLSKYSNSILNLNGLGIYQYAKLISLYKDKIDNFNSSFSKIIYLESDKSNYIDIKQNIAKKYNFNFKLVENTSHYMMIDASELICKIIKEYDDR